MNDGERGSGIIESIRAMLKKDDRKRVKLDLNELIREVMRLTQGQFQRHGVSICSNSPKICRLYRLIASSCSKSFSICL